MKIEFLENFVQQAQKILGVFEACIYKWYLSEIPGSIFFGSDSDSGTTSPQALVPIRSPGLPKFKFWFRFRDDSES